MKTIEKTTAIMNAQKVIENEITELNELVATLSTAMRDNLASEIAKVNELVKVSLKNVNASFVTEFIRQYKDVDHPVAELIKVGDVKIYSVKTARTKGKATGCELKMDKMEVLDLFDIEQVLSEYRKDLFADIQWLGAVAHLNAIIAEQEIKDLMSTKRAEQWVKDNLCEYAGVISLESKTSKAKLLQKVCDSIAFEEGEKGLNKYKVTTLHINYILKLYVKENKNNYGVVMPSNDKFRILIMKALHLAFTGEEIEVTVK